MPAIVSLMSVIAWGSIPLHTLNEGTKVTGGKFMQMSFFLKNCPAPGSSWAMKTTACHAGHFSLAISQTGYLNSQVASGQLTPWHLRHPQPLPRTKEQPRGRVGDNRRVSHTPKPCAWKIVFKGNSGWRTEIFHDSSHSLWAQESCASRPRYTWHIKRDVATVSGLHLRLEVFLHDSSPTFKRVVANPIAFSGCWL